MYNAIHRGHTSLIMVAGLLGTELVGALLSLLLKNVGGATPAHALLGFVLPAGLVMFASIITGMFSADNLITFELNKQEAKDDWWPALGMSAVIGFTQMLVIFVALALMADSPNANEALRSSGWVFLALFCTIMTLLVSYMQAMVQDRVSGKYTFWSLRWAFLASFLLLPIELCYEASAALVWVTLALQVILAMPSLFMFQAVKARASYPYAAPLSTETA